MDLDLRKLRYFVAVAEHAGFRRAADALHIAQPALTRQIRALERELDVSLFERSVRGTELTAAGRQLLEEAEPLLVAAETLQRRVGHASAAVPRLSIGFTPGVFIAPVVKAYSLQRPDVVVEFLGTPTADQARLIRGGRLDVGFARLPIAAEGLTLIPLFEEQQVLALPAGHPLTRSRRVTVRDLAGLALLQGPCAVPEVPAAGPVPPERSEGGLEAQRTPAATVEDQLEHVAAERGVCVLPQSTAALYTRAGVVYRAVDGLAPSLVALAHGAAGKTDQVRHLITLAVAMMGTPARRRSDGQSTPVRGTRARSA